MSILPDQFSAFETPIHKQYAWACTDAGITPETIELKLVEQSSHLKRYESEFAAITPPPIVSVTWNGLASLWACAHAFARTGGPMFQAQRSAVNSIETPPVLQVTPTVQTGLYLFELSTRLAKNRFDRWIDWAPEPTATPATDEDKLGNLLFFGSLAWILRHELAHHVLNHHKNRSSIPEDSIRQEHEADTQATKWLKADFKVDENRAAGAHPSKTEMELERRSLCMLVGITWLIQFECIPHAKSTTHPNAASRLDNIIAILNLAEDSFAYEMMSYAIKVLIGPEEIWPSDSDKPSAKDAIVDALIRLNRKIQTFT
jgi:hypothetical protein